MFSSSAKSSDLSVHRLDLKYPDLDRPFHLSCDPTRYIPSMDEFSPSVEPPDDVSDSLVKELVSALHTSVQIADDHELDNTSSGEEEECDGCGGSKITSNQKHLSRYHSFPSPTEMMSPLSSDKDDEEPDSALQGRFLEEHAPLKLVSAMRGSRQKQGAAQRNLRVTWAPDVYDPIPTSVSHAGRRGSKQQKVSRKDKRHGKRGHKGKESSRGSGSKDSSNGTSGKDKKKKKKKKKQLGQTPLSSNTCYKLLDPGNGALDLNPDQVENYGMGILDTSCASSFLKISLTTAHYPVAEAL